MGQLVFDLDSILLPLQAFELVKARPQTKITRFPLQIRLLAPFSSIFFRYGGSLNTQ